MESCKMNSNSKISSTIRLNDIFFAYGPRIVFCGLSACIQPGRITALLGRNGSGKTTLLNMLAGLVHPSEGYLEIPASYRLHLGYVFQNYRETLFPWSTVRANLLFPLKVQKIAVQEAQSRLKEIADLFAIEGHLDQYPYELSGGQQQIVAFARALIAHPRLLLLDEPFAALDYENTLRMYHVLRKFQEKYDMTVVIVTHNPAEADALADSRLGL